MRGVELPNVPEELDKTIFYEIFHAIEAGESGPDLFSEPVVQDLEQVVLHDSGLPLETAKQRGKSLRKTRYALGRFGQDRGWV